MLKSLSGYETKRILDLPLPQRVPITSEILYGFLYEEAPEEVLGHPEFGHDCDEIARDDIQYYGASI